MKNTAKMFLNFCTAYLLAIKTTQPLVMRDMLAKNEDGTVRRNGAGAPVVLVGSIIESFARCSIESFDLTLCLLHWSAHCLAPTTMNHYRAAVREVIVAYVADRNRSLDGDDPEVCFNMCGCT
jgi:hypothetical protein